MAIGVGIIGLGMATKPHMTSLRELEAIGRTKIVGGFAPSPERRCARTSRRALRAASTMPPPHWGPRCAARPTGPRWRTTSRLAG